MRTHSVLVLDIRELLASPGVQKLLEFRVPLELEAGLTKLVGELNLGLVLEAIEGGIVVRGELSGAYEGSCRRCVKPVSSTFKVKSSEIYRPEGEVWEEGYVVKDETIDLEPMVRDCVGLALPINPLCRDECAGICTRCGADLNEGPCSCGEEVDHRWSALSELKERLRSAPRGASEEPSGS